MGSFVTRSLTWAAALAYGFFTVVLYGCIAIKQGTFFQRASEKEKLELELARDRLWNLSKDWSGLSHHMITLRSSFKFHFVSNDTPATPAALKSSKPLVILVHGFPDSWAVWRQLISSPSLQKTATLVAIDLPGYGGTDDLDTYSATNVYEKVTELIVALRVQYGVDQGEESNKKKVIVVGHDWGCLVSMRLAAEAPSLAHRFILTNGPLVHLAESNIRRLLSSSLKMFKTALRSPLQSRTPLVQAFRSLGPLFRQLVLSGYIFAFQLPFPIVEYFMLGGNYSLMKGIHKASTGNAELTSVDAAESMASGMGPSAAESRTETASGDTYPATLRDKHVYTALNHKVSYYRDGAAIQRWQKSLETITSLHSLGGGHDLRRTSSGTGLFDEEAPGVLQASSTIIWGQKDIALDPHICLDGIADYLVTGSQVVMLPESGHWTPVETESRAAIEKAIEWAALGEKQDVGVAIQAAYPSAKVTVRR
ncbi:uncharacterized protein PFLUO_LOCUS1518 [Penicillium psychrofluorescens]|uniref:uncharacterized protein n=1 Tax=Penicillium psychrofluorescens TaxID=3158075 RepID=UPI003CCCBADB